MSEIKSIVTSIIGSHPQSPPGAGSDWPRAAWEQLYELGYTRLLLPENSGGGGSLSQALEVAEAGALSYFNAPLGDSVLLTTPLCHIAGIEVSPGYTALALSDDLRLDTRDGRITICGSATDVPWLRYARSVILPVPRGRATALVRLNADSAGVGVLLCENLAGEARDGLTLTDVPCDVLDLPDGDWPNWIRKRGALVRAAQMAAVADTVLALTSDYIKTRSQFGRPLSRFQVVQHKFVELASSVQLMRAAVSGAIGSGKELAAANDLGVAIAKAECSATAGSVAAIAHQLHGAIGFTKEYSLGAATTRLWSWRDEFGSESDWWQFIGRAVTRDPAGWWAATTDR